MTAEPAIAPRRAAAGQNNAASGPVQFLGDLAAGLAAADDQDIAFWQLPLVVIAAKLQLWQRSGQRIGATRLVGFLVSSGRQNQMPRRPRPLVGPDDKAGAVRGADIFDLRLCADRRAEACSISFQIVDDLVARHEAVGIVAVIGKTRQLHGPVRRDEAKGVPAVAPALADPPLFQNDVVDAALRQFVTDCQTGLTGSDNDCVCLLHRGSPMVQAHKSIARIPISRKFPRRRLNSSGSAPVPHGPRPRAATSSGRA